MRLKKRLTGAIGLTKGNNYILDLSFDILSLEALFLVPRYASTTLQALFVPLLLTQTKDLLACEPQFILRQPSNSNIPISGNV